MRWIDGHGAPFPERRRALLDHMGIARYSAFIALATVAVMAMVEGAGNDNYHMPRVFSKSETPSLDHQSIPPLFVLYSTGSKFTEKSK